MESKKCRNHLLGLAFNALNGTAERPDFTGVDQKSPSTTKTKNEFDSHCLPPILRSLSAAIVSHRIKRLSRSVPAEAASHPSPSSP